MSVTINATYPEGESVGTGETLQIRAFIVDPSDSTQTTEATYPGNTACVESEGACTNEYTRVVGGLSPRTAYTFRVYASYGTTQSTTFSTVSTTGKTC